MARAQTIPIFENCTLLFFKGRNLSSPLAPLWEGGLTYALGNFFVRNSISNNFYLKLFLMWCVFLVASRPKLSLFPCFCASLCFIDGYLLSPLAPLQGGRHMRSQTFLHEIQFQKLLFKAFFDVMCVFGDVEPQIGSIFPFWILVCIRMSAHSRDRLRCCIFTFTAWYVSINIEGYGWTIEGLTVKTILVQNRKHYLKTKKKTSTF